MAAMPKQIAISDLCLRQSEVLDELGRDPLVLTHRNRAVAVLVSVEKWNELMEELEGFQDVIAAQEAELDGEPYISLEDYLAERAARVSRRAN